MRVLGQNLPSFYLDLYKRSLQPSAHVNSNTEFAYGNFKYNQGKYGSYQYVKTRNPFRLPTMQGLGE